MVETTTTSGTIEVPDVVVFSHDGSKITAADVLAEVEPELVDQLRLQVALGRSAQASRPADDDARRDHERDFRKARQLMAAEEMEKWLHQIALPVENWRRHLREEVALRDWGPAQPPEPADDIDDDALWAALVCTGELERLCTDLASRLVAAEARGEDEPSAQAVEAFLADAVTEQIIDSEIHQRAIDWLWVRWDQVVAPEATADAEREVIRCLQDDRANALDVAALVGGESIPGSCHLVDAPSDLRDLLVEIDVGTARRRRRRQRKGCDVIAVHERRRPDPHDPSVREAVRARLAEHALEQARKDRIRWHARF